MSDDGNDAPGLGLDEVLAALRDDLVAARDDTSGGGYGLGVAEVEVELSVEVARSAEGEGSVGAKWFVLTGEASGRVRRDRTRAHRIRLTLRPTPSGEVAGAAGVTAVPDDPDEADEADAAAGVSGGAAATVIGPKVASGAEVPDGSDGPDGDDDGARGVTGG